MKDLIIYETVRRTVLAVTVFLAVIALLFVLTVGWIVATVDTDPAQCSECIAGNSIVLDGNTWMCQALDPSNGQCAAYLKVSE